MALVPCEEVVVSALLITVVAGPCAHLNYFTEYLLPSTSTGSQSNRKSKLLAAPDRLSIVLKIPCFKWRGLMLVEVMLSFLLAMQLGFLIYGCKGSFICARRSKPNFNCLEMKEKKERNFCIFTLI